MKLKLPKIPGPAWVQPAVYVYLGIGTIAGVATLVNDLSTGKTQGGVSLPLDVVLSVLLWPVALVGTLTKASS